MARLKAIAAYAAEMAGTRFDLDEDFEAINTKWLPFCRSSTNPARLSARITFLAVRDGSLAMNQTGTVTLP
jgi:hypothetical protein